MLYRIPLIATNMNQYLSYFIDEYKNMESMPFQYCNLGVK